MADAKRAEQVKRAETNPSTGSGSEIEREATQRSAAEEAKKWADVDCQFKVIGKTCVEVIHRRCAPCLLRALLAEGEPPQPAPVAEQAQLREALEQLICSHNNRTGGNDYLLCNDCGLQWDYRSTVSPEDVARTRAKAALTSQPTQEPRP